MFLFWGVGGLLIFARSAAARLTAACLRHIDVEWNREKGVPRRCCSWLRLPLLLLLPLLLQCHMIAARSCAHRRWLLPKNQRSGSGCKGQQQVAGCSSFFFSACNWPGRSVGRVRNGRISAGMGWRACHPQRRGIGDLCRRWLRLSLNFRRHLACAVHLLPIALSHPDKQPKKFVWGMHAAPQSRRWGWSRGQN